MKKTTNTISNVFHNFKKTWFALQLLIVTAIFPVTFYMQAINNNNLPKESAARTYTLKLIKSQNPLHAKKTTYSFAAII